MKLTPAERQKYLKTYLQAQIRPEKREVVASIVDRLFAAKEKYDLVVEATGVPWWAIASLHLMESNLSFAKHLHNGDPLTARTVNEPKNRPPKGEAPFSFEDSAIDALKYDSLDHQFDWSIPNALYYFERYNGFGYRKYGINSPYLWSMTTAYEKGKFVKDKVFDAEKVSSQVGIAAIMYTVFTSVQSQTLLEDLAIEYNPSKFSKEAANLQHRLNEIDGIAVSIDGYPGSQTADAYLLATGKRLLGDNRDEKANT